MLTAERHRYILQTLRRDGKVLASRLSLDLNVSEDTIRRDLRELAEAGQLQRVHGGALLRSPATASYMVRQQHAPVAKERIARAAVQLIRPGQVIILDGGTTTLLIANSLPPDLHATVITNSPPIGVALAEHPYVETVMVHGLLGRGLLRKSGGCLQGERRYPDDELFCRRDHRSPGREPAGACNRQ